MNARPVSPVSVRGSSPPPMMVPPPRMDSLSPMGRSLTTSSPPVRSVVPASPITQPVGSVARPKYPGIGGRSVPPFSWGDPGRRPPGGPDGLPREPSRPSTPWFFDVFKQFSDKGWGTREGRRGHPRSRRSPFFKGGGMVRM